MVLIEIPENPNGEAVDMRMFRDVVPPRPIDRVLLAASVPVLQWSP